MAKEVLYKEKFTSANTIYADIVTAEKLYMLSQIERAYYELIERTNYDELARQVFMGRDKVFRKHISSGNSKLNNSLGSFLAGLLKQHQNKPDKDISTKMLPGIELACEIFNALQIHCPQYKFIKRHSKRVEQDAFGRLFK